MPTRKIGSRRPSPNSPSPSNCGATALISPIFRQRNRTDELGALNLYSERAGEFTERSEQVGWLLASHAAVAFASARTDAQLREAMATRQEIAEAMGILMERYKVTERHAFAMLVKSSQNRNVKLREIARAITHTGEIPEAP